jgi:Bacterial pre-peptidase C-terminal domain
MSHRILGNTARAGLLAAALLVLAAPRVHAQGQIAIGQAMTSQLTSASPVNSDGRRYALWTFSGSAGQFVQIDMQSSEIDSYLILQDQYGNQLQFNDDGGGGLNSRLTYTLPYTGAYRIMAMSFRTSGVITGTYTLSIAGGGQPAQPMIQPMANPSGVVGTIGLGQQAQGVLSQADARYDGKPFQAYNFQCTAGQAFQFAITSSWDNYARVFDPMGSEVAHDDDSGGSLNARVTYTCAVTGTYRLAVTVFSPSTTPGPYTMTVTSIGGPGMAPTMQPMANPSGVVGTIQAGQQAQGVLSQADARYEGKPFQAYNFQCNAGQPFQMDVESSWDNYALVFDPMGNVVAQDDDSGEGLNARISYTCVVTGTYRLAVSVYAPSTTPGPYTMRVTGMAGPMQPVIQPAQPTIQPAQPTIQPAQPSIQPAPGQTLPQPAISGGIAAPGQVATIAYGQMMQGRLEPGDQTMNDGTFADVWTFQGTGGQTVTIDVMSDEFDAYAQLLDAAGNQLAEDDDSGGNLNARITFTLAASGQFQIVVNNYGDSRRTGLYRVWLH